VVVVKRGEDLFVWLFEYSFLLIRAPFLHFSFPPSRRALSIPAFIFIFSFTHPPHYLTLHTGMPAVAASGNIAANNLVSIGKHMKMLDKIRM
jgi:hypothetical protein